MRIIRNCLFCCLFTFFPLLAVAAQENLTEPIVVDRIAAVVNGEMITLHELRQHAAAELARSGVNPADPSSRQHIEMVMRKVLSIMIDNILLRQEAERLKVKVTDSEIDNELRKIIQRNQVSTQEFEARLAAQGGSLEMLKEQIRNNIMSQRIISVMIARKSVVTDEEVRNYYDEHARDFSTDRSVDISLIVFAPSANAQEISAQIASGKLSFDEAARKHSEGPEPDNGGRLGVIKWDDLAPALKAQIVSLQLGEASPLFQINSRDCMLRLNGATDGRSMSFEEAAPEIEKILREPRLQERFVEYTEQLRKRAVIDVRL